MLTESQKDHVEGTLSWLFGDCLEIVDIGENIRLKYARGVVYAAEIVYDGNNDKANKGCIRFCCRPINDKVEDLFIIEYWGRNYLNPQMIKQNIEMWNTGVSREEIDENINKAIEARNNP